MRSDTAALFFQAIKRLLNRTYDICKQAARNAGCNQDQDQRDKNEPNDRQNDTGSSHTILFRLVG